MKLQIYEASAFDGGSSSYASQGRCSFCGQGAKYMSESKSGKRKAYCDNHAVKHFDKIGPMLASIFPSVRNTKWR